MLNNLKNISSLVQGVHESKNNFGKCSKVLEIGLSMKKNILFILIFSLLYMISSIRAQQVCIILKNNEIIYQEGDCNKRYSPCSIFKIAISLMGYNEGILKSKIMPEWPYNSSYDTDRLICQQSHNPFSWIKNSVVWYSQVIVQMVGITNFQSYIEKFDYGNMDSIGNSGKQNAFVYCWLSSSLKISVLEQIYFLEKLIYSELPISQVAMNLTRDLFWLELLPNGFELYGKTGLGFVNNREIG